MDSRTRDRRRRYTFWIDDRVVDEFAPVMARYPFGASALAVYLVLARRADREGESWPRLELIAAESGTSARTVQRAIRLLEILGLVEVAHCYEQGSNRQTSNLYTLLTPPQRLPEIDPDPEKWPPPKRRTLLVRGGSRSEAVATRAEQGSLEGIERSDARPVRTEREPAPTLTAPRVVSGTPRHPDTPPPDTVTPRPRQADTPSPVTRSPQEGNTGEGNTLKERSSGPSTSGPVFTIEEVGLTNRQVWAAALGELARRGDVSRGELEAWLRPAALTGREGATLIIGAPNAPSRDRIATRLLPAVRDAIGATIGTAVDIAVVVTEPQRRGTG